MNKLPAVEEIVMRIKLSIACLMLSLGVEAAGQSTTWDFEGDSGHWKPRAATVKVEHVTQISAIKTSRACLHIHGNMQNNWNYAVSNPVPMQAGHLYRLSASLRVVSAGSGTPMPFLKCEFVAADPKRELGRAVTNSYEAAHPGQWQHLTGEFEAPSGTVSCWVALEKGTSAPTRIDAYLDDVTIEPIAQLTALSRYELDPVPPTLQKVRHVHPRLYLNAERVAKLRSEIQTSHADLWADVKVLADKAVKQGAPKYRKDDSRSGDEQLWQRSVGNTMPYLAMAYLMTGEARYLEASKQWALASCGYPTWGYGQLDGMDLAAGHQLFGLAIIYDWCYHALDEATKQRIRETLIKRASAMFKAAATGKIWWHRAYLQNHLWVNACGLAAAGFALFDEDEQALLWIGLAQDKFRRTMNALGPDGASQEGVGYWEYGAEYMLKFMYLADELLGVDLYDNPWWRNTARYCQYLSLPEEAWAHGDCIVDIADCPRTHWYGPDHILRELARRYRDGHAQWLAEQVDKANVDAPSARWLNLIWHDPTVQAIHPTTLPTLHHFEDMGIVSARTGWDGRENLVVFKCGPFIGHKAIDEFSYDPGGGHVHPDAGHFIVFADGHWLIRDDGYQDKWTGQHNTLLINGVGQLGEGHTWFNGTECLSAKARPRIICASSSAELDHIAGDATAAYPSTTGLKRFVRHLLFVKPNVLIVLDDIVLDRSADLELRLHTESSNCKRRGERCVVTGDGVVLCVDLLTAGNTKVDAGNLPARGRHGANVKLFTIRFTTHDARWRNAIALSWAPPGKEVKHVVLVKGERTWTFAVADRKLVFDWETGRVALQP
jgi:Domain of unknown function (DUF4962)/Heparinase II/III-like protein